MQTLPTYFHALKTTQLLGYLHSVPSLPNYLQSQPSSLHCICQLGESCVCKGALILALYIMVWGLGGGVKGVSVMLEYVCQCVHAIPLSQGGRNSIVPLSSVFSECYKFFWKSTVLKNWGYFFLYLFTCVNVILLSQGIEMNCRYHLCFESEL